MVIWIILGVLTVAGLCYTFYSFGKTRGGVRLGQPGENQRFADSLMRGSPSRHTTPIRHNPIQGPPIVVTSKISQGVTVGYYKSLTDPEAEVITAVHYDGTHHEKHIPAGSYRLIDDLGTFYVAEEFERAFAPAEVGYVVPPECLPSRAQPIYMEPHPSGNTEESQQLDTQMFQKLAEEFEFPVTPKTYAGPCEHSVAREQLKKIGKHYPGIGHFIPCRECGQVFEFIHTQEQAASNA